MLTNTPLSDGRLHWVCSDCGRGMVLDAGEPARHVCKTTGKTETKFPGREAVTVPTPPDLLQRTRNFGVALTQHLAAGAPKASDDQVKERWAICQKCPGNYFKTTGEGTGQCTHHACGCGVFTVGAESGLWPNKLRWADQRCPAGYWGAVVPPPSPS
jgi:hypothetical protein